MYLVGGSEGSLLSNTSSQITGYEPGVNSTKKKNQPQSTLPTAHTSIRYRSSYLLYFLINIGSCMNTITSSSLFTPIPHNAPISLPIPPINALHTTMSIPKTQPLHRLNSDNYMCWKKPRPHRTSESRGTILSPERRPRQRKKWNGGSQATAEGTITMITVGIWKRSATAEHKDTSGPNAGNEFASKKHGKENETADEVARIQRARKGKPTRQLQLSVIWTTRIPSD